MTSIDVIIPNYQYGRYLGEAVSSVLHQDISGLRILIIDNASTDDSVDIARGFAACNPQVEVRVHATNVGFHASVNEGLEWASSDYLMVLCSDDLLPAGALMRAMSIMDDNPSTAFAYGAYSQMRSSEDAHLAPNPTMAAWKIQRGAEFIHGCTQKMVHAVAPLVRTRIQKQAGYLRPELKYTSDLEMLLRLACFGDIAATPVVQGIQRIHEANESMSFWNDPLLAMTNDLVLFDSFFRHDGKHLPDAAAMHRQARRNIGEDAYWKGMAAGLQGRWQVGVDLLRLAVSLTPRAAIIPPLRRLTKTDQPVQRIRRLLATAVGIKARGGPNGEART